MRDVQLADEIEAAAQELFGSDRTIPELTNRFTISQRALIANRLEELIYQAIEKRRAARRRKNAKIRAMTPKRKRQPCIACGASALISQSHHVYPVASSDPADPRCTRTVWLCPNCHATLHLVARKFSLTHWKQLMAEGLLEGGRHDAIQKLVAEMRERG